MAWSTRKLKTNAQSGFTLVELLVVLTIILILFGLTTINLGQSVSTTNTATTVDSLLADLRNQQLLSMVGGNGSSGTQQPHGIVVQATKYTLFSSAVYSSSDSSNFDVSTGPSVTLSTTLPSSQVVFNKGDGSVAGFTAGSNTITVTTAGTSHTITINRFGATTVN